MNINNYKYEMCEKKGEMSMERYEYTINGAKKEIKNSISVYMMKDESGKYILPENKKNPFYVVGAPGIGKTEMAAQIADELGIGFMSTSLSHHTRNSVLGLPVITDFNGEKSTEYTMSDIILQVMKKYEAGQKEGILLIDEFASMSEALVAPMLAFLQNKCVGNHYLPEGWVLILCSNPPEYNETARRFGPAVMDRVRIINVAYSKEDFMLYARQTAMHPAVIDYVNNNSRNVYVCEENGDEQQIVTTRGWENLSQCLYGYEKLGLEVTDALIYQFIKSPEIAGDFYNYYMLSMSAFKSQDISNIINGINIDKNVARMRDFEFNKKLQISDLIINQLSAEAGKTVINMQLMEYLDKWIDEWQNLLDGDNLYETLYNADNIMEDVIKSRLGYAVQGYTTQYYPKVFKNANDNYDEEKMIKDIYKLIKLKKKDGSNKEKGNELVLKVMREYYADMQEKLKEALHKQDTKVSNVINYMNEIGDNKVKDYFVRKLNIDDNLLYILSKTDNKEYTEELSHIYGRVS